MIPLRPRSLLLLLVPLSACGLVRINGKPLGGGDMDSASAPAVSEPGAAWLLFADDAGLAAAVAGRLRRVGADVTTVVPGDKFARLEDGSVTLGTDGRRDYDRLVAELGQGGRFPSRVLHLWSVIPPENASSHGLADVQARGFYSLLFLAQALADAGIREPIRLGVVVNSLHEVTGEPVIGPERATVLGRLG